MLEKKYQFYQNNSYSLSFFPLKMDICNKRFVILYK